ncbi:hypothetical protein RCH10_000809 [Variovorax sp. GrIS 2.14]|jgi:hypothetical protein|uniref:hypothetical protein n=1 Tax=Variovorax sp. GrIS 2.14 TaxID=3071709 RepID=UPI0038F65DAE
MDRGPVSSRQRARRLGTLRSRADHLDRRISAEPNRQADFDRAELKALRWAIGELETPVPKDE